MREAFGAFRRQTVEEVGGYNEHLLTNEDYEFNVRLRQAGKMIWLDPQVRSVYFARPTFVDLARQYWRYGFWKARMLRRYPDTIRWRQALPPLFVISLLGVFLSGIFWSPAFLLLVLELIGYVFVLSIVGFKIALEKEKWFYLPGVPLSIGIMHISWGSALIWSWIRNRKNIH